MASKSTDIKSKLRKGLEKQKEIDALLQERASLSSILEDRLAEFKEKMTNLHSQERVSKWNSVAETKIKNLQMKHKMLELSLKKLKLKQELEACPAAVMDDLKQALEEILVENEKLEAELNHLDEVEAQYEALGPPFKELLQEWMELEEKIAIKEWALKEVENMQNSSGFDDSVLSDSFHA